MDYAFNSLSYQCKTGVTRLYMYVCIYVYTHIYIFHFLKNHHTVVHSDCITYIPNSSTKVLILPYHCQLLLVVVLMVAVLSYIKWHLTVYRKIFSLISRKIIWFSLMSINIEHVSLQLSFCMSLEKCIFKAFALNLIWLFCAVLKL